LSPGTKISALIEYSTPHTILTAISGQRREIYFRLRPPPPLSLLCPAGPGAAGWAQPPVSHATD